MVTFLGMMVDDVAPDFASDSAPRSFKKVECAVDRGFVYPRHPALYLSDYTIRPEMPFVVVKHLDNQAALGSQFQPAGPEYLITTHCNCT
jgi:hypothetical protein